MENPATGVSISDLRGYLRVLWRNKWLLAIASLITAALAVGATIAFTTPKYEAYTDLLERRSGLDRAFIGTDLFSELGYQPDRVIDTDVELVKSPEVVNRVTDRLGNELGATSPAGITSVSPLNKTDILRISATSENPQIAADVANAFAEEFINWRKQADQNVLTAAREPVEAQVNATPPDQQDSASYRALIDKLDSLKLVEMMQTGDLEVVKPAGVPGSPVSPKPLMTGTLVFFVTLLLGIVLVLLKDRFDTRVRSADEITEKIDKPILATVPQIPSSSNGFPVTLSNPTGGCSEAYRLLKTNLGYIQPDRQIKTIMVTSPEPGEGKSTTIANLAITLARAGQRVIILEGDLRRPMLSTYLGLDNSVGFTNAITGACSLRESLQMIEAERLSYSAASSYRAEGSTHDRMFQSMNGIKPIYCATSGPLPPNPGELAASDRVGGLIAEAREYADIVLIDAPPLGLVGDAAGLASKVDGIVLVLRLMQTSRKSLDEIGTFISTVPGNVLGLVVTNASASNGYGYESYGGYYGEASAY